MKYLILLIIFTSCFVPEKGGYFEFRYMKLAEIQKVDSGFDLIWVDGLGREAKVLLQILQDVITSLVLTTR